MLFRNTLSDDKIRFVSAVIGHLFRQSRDSAGYSFRYRPSKLRGARAVEMF